MTRPALLRALPALLLLAACAAQERPPEADDLQPAAAESVTVPVEPSRGLEVAERWCASCHQVSPDGPPRTPAPAVMAIAADPAKDRDWLETFMAEDHLPMPTFRLYPDEQAHVIAYLESLR